MQTFGSDPELMIAHPKTGKLHSAIGIVPGTVKDPVCLGEHRYYYDNVLAECAIAPGAGKEEVVGKFRDCFAKFAKMVAPFRLVARASADYPAAELRHPMARVVGCNPEWDGYTILEMEKPNEQFQAGTLRTAGGHVHLGGEGTIRDRNMVHYYVKMLDLFLGLPSIYIDHDPTSRRRREIYGVMGSHRRKDYGLEYRVLGNFWVASPVLVGLVYDICEWTCGFVEGGGHAEFYRFNPDALAEALRTGSSRECAWTPTQFDINHLRNIIHTSQQDHGRWFMDLTSRYLPFDLRSRISQASRPVQYDFYKEWEL